MCSIESMANSTYKHPKITFVPQWIHCLKVDLLERANAQPSWLAFLITILRLSFNIILLNIYYGVLELYNRKYFKLILYIDIDCLLYDYYKKLTYWDNSDHEKDCKHNFKEENIITSFKIYIPTSIVRTLNHN